MIFQLALLIACGGSPPAAPTAEVAPPPTEVAPVAAPEATVATAPDMALHSPPKDSAERTAILDGLRAKLEPELTRPPIFVVRTLRSAEGFAWFVGEPREQDGSEFDFSTTTYKEALADGVMDGANIYALLRYETDHWKALEVAVAPTDVAWDGWDKKHGAPASLWAD